MAARQKLISSGSIPARSAKRAVGPIVAHSRAAATMYAYPRDLLEAEGLTRSEEETAPVLPGAVLRVVTAQEQDFFTQVTVFDVECEPPLPVAVSVTV